MIISISIKNIALIENLKVNFFDGLNIITGETGAGKSILLSSIGLAIGDKADTQLIRTGSQKGSVEIVFDIANNSTLKKLLGDLSIDIEDNTLIIKREITSEPRSRSFINLNSVPNSTLKTIGEYLVDISSQHEHQSLLRPQTHIELLDNFANLSGQREEFTRKFIKVNKLKSELNRLSTNEEEKEKQLEIYQYAIEEIEEHQLKEGEDIALEQELDTLNNFEKINRSIESAYHYLYTQDHSVIPYIEKVIFELEKVTQFNLEIKKTIDDIREALYLLENVKDTVRSYKDSLGYSFDRIEEINQRLNTVKDLKRKYGKTISDIIAYRDYCKQEILKISHNKDSVAKLDTEIKQKEKEVSEIAIKLSKARQKKAKVLEKDIERELAFLGMEKSLFKVEFSYIEDSKSYLQILNKGVKIEEHGIDKVEFIFSANPGEMPKPLIKIVSGGELSRVMLTIKTILTEMDEVDTLLFDEVDAGIGGEMSIKVAKKVKDISNKRQILCITHSPPIASYSKHHYFVEKFEEYGRTKTTIKKLNEEEKIKEIARMIGGNKTTELSLEHAKEVIEKTKE